MTSSDETIGTLRVEHRTTVLFVRSRQRRPAAVTPRYAASTTQRNPMFPVELSGVFFERAATLYRLHQLR